MKNHENYEIARERAITSLNQRVFDKADANSNFMIALSLESIAESLAIIAVEIKDNEN